MPAQGSRRALFRLLITFFCLAFVFIAYCTATVLRSSRLYEDIKIMERPLAPMQNRGRTVGQLIMFDPVLGMKLLPNANGAFLIPKGEPIAFRHDSEGLRARPDMKPSPQGAEHPKVLFLGDSFTYGSLVAAEDTFASKSAEKLGGEAVNAGVPGYSLAQMLLQAEELIPKYKPDYVVVQYSPWLVSRSLSGFAQDGYGMIMAPFFYETERRVDVYPVPFTPPPEVASIAEKYKRTPSGLHDQLGFLWEIGFPFLAHRDINISVFRLKQLFGLAPRPAVSSEGVIHFAYKEFEELSRKHDTKMVILALGYAEQLHVPWHLFPEDSEGVNGWLFLAQHLAPQTPNEYVRSYYLWRGLPLQPVDWHPNEQAHGLIAEAVVLAIEGLEADK